jgi:hypothetical protein
LPYYPDAIASLASSTGSSIELRSTDNEDTTPANSYALEAVDYDGCYVGTSGKLTQVEQSEPFDVAIEIMNR